MNLEFTPQIHISVKIVLANYNVQLDVLIAGASIASSGLNLIFF